MDATTEWLRMETRERAASDLKLVCAICLVALLLLSLSPSLFNDGDMSWHLATGKFIIEHGAVPDTDPFSFTAFGRPWVAHEWLSEVIMAAVFQTGSWPALSLLFATAVAGLLFMIGVETRRWLTGAPLAAVMLAVFVTLAPFVVARPHVLAWPVMAGWMILLLRAREAERTPPLPAALLMMLWANLHGSFVFGIALIGPFALEALIESKEKRATFLRWTGFGLASLGAAALTPHGLHGLLFPLQLTSMESLPVIQEWRPTILSEMLGFKIVLLATIFAALSRGLKVPPIRLLLLVGILFLAFQHVRHQAVLAIVGALLLAQPFAGAAHPRFGSLKPLPRFSILACIGLTLAVWAMRPLLPFERQDSASNPLTAIAALPAQLRGQPVLNSYSFGGPLILSGIRPFIDGRADMYGDEAVFEHQALMDGDMARFRAAADKWNIRWTILSPQNVLAAKMDDEPGWRRIYADQWAVVHVSAGSTRESLN